jgi:hypothetical protein
MFRRIFNLSLVPVISVFVLVFFTRAFPLQRLLRSARSVAHLRPCPARAFERGVGLRLTLNNFAHRAVPVMFGALGSFFGVAPVFIANAVLLAGGNTDQ